MKRSLFIVAIMVATCCVVFAAGTEEAEEGGSEAVTLRLGHGATATHPLQETSLRFAELIEERTEGRVTVDVFPNRQIGEEREMVEGLQLGTVDLTIVSTGPLGQFVREIGVFDLPFLFESSEHAYRVLDGEIGESILAGFEPVGIIGLSFMENGWRNLSTGEREVRVPADLEGMKIRTMQNDVHMAAFHALGASPVPMAWGEVYTGLQQGIIDGQENPVPIIYTNSLWEVQNHYALTGHFYTPYAFLMSRETWERLSAADRQVIKETAKEVAGFQRAMMAEQSDEQIVLLREEGMNVYEVDRGAFREATRAVYDEYANVFGTDLIEQIRAAAE